MATTPPENLGRSNKAKVSGGIGWNSIVKGGARLVNAKGADEERQQESHNFGREIPVK